LKKTDRRQLKRTAGAAIHDGKPSIVLIGLVFILLCLVLEFLSMKVSGDLDALRSMTDSMLSGGEMIVPETESSVAGDILTFALSLMSVMLSVGFTIACLNTARRTGAAYGNLFESFGMLLRAFCVLFLRSLILSLWAMIAVLPMAWFMTSDGLQQLLPLLCLPLMYPAVRAFYGYRQAVYLMIDNPKLNAVQCLQASRQLMEGHKWELFKLDLSFIGWFLLCAIPLVTVWVLPYTSVCYALYHDDILNRYYAAHMPQGNAPVPGQAEDGGAAEVSGQDTADK